jgi:hypothetical protein
MTMQKCKNCQQEFEKGKYCPECGFPVEIKKEKSELAMEILERMDTRLAKLEKAEDERIAARENFKKQRKERKDNGENKSSGNPAGRKSRSIFDIFGESA